MVALGKKEKKLACFFVSLVCRVDIFLFVQCTSHLNVYITVNRKG